VIRKEGDMDKTVKVYSTTTCPYCVRAKQFLKENNITYEDIDVSSDQAAAEEMIRKSGQMGVPVLDIDGQIIVGFDKERIKQALGL
jgi:glutaredoxin-like YruB-family protein